jgi:DNA-binding CsgD family transcriptional regulator
MIAFTHREKQIGRMISVGSSRKQIAGELGISPKTADIHLRNIRSKTGMETTFRAGLFLLQNRHLLV